MTVKPDNSLKIKWVYDEMYFRNTAIIDSRRHGDLDKLANQINKRMGEGVGDTLAETLRTAAACTYEISREGTSTEEIRAVLMIFNIDEDAGMIAHECLHAAETHMRHIGMQPTEENEEARAYYLGWLVCQVTDFLDKNDQLEKRRNARQRAARRASTKSAKQRRQGASRGEKDDRLE